jgi:predicted permease
VRQASRRREFAVRSALGAGRMRLARQLTTETVVLSVAGGAAGLGFARAIIGVLVSNAPESVGRLDSVSIDLAVVAFTMAGALVIGALLGVFSALSVWRDRSADNLRAAGVSDRNSALRKVLVGAEAAVALVLIIATALLGASLLRLQRVDVGFDTANLLTFNLSKGPAADDDARQEIQFFDRVLERIRAVPGVKQASAAVTLPIGGDDFGGALFVEGRPLPPPGTARRLGFQVVAQGWFETLGMRMLEGRDFSTGDTPDTIPVLMVNRTLAEQEWPGLSAIGQRVRRSRDPMAPLYTVVGVVSDIRHGGPSSLPRPEFYLPLAQSPFSFMAFAVRTEGPSASFAQSIRAAVADVAPSVPAADIRTMQQHLTRAYGRARFLSTLTIAFGVLGLGLALVGVYGVTSFSVAQRTREFGVRTALGASGLQLARGIIRDDMAPVLAGVVIGLGIGVAASKGVQGLLFETSRLDAPAYVTATIVLLATAFIAALIPARRAARIDPVTALRDA